MKNLKTSFLQRTPMLLSATVKILAGKNSDSVLENLSELKGVPQKIGQMLSMDVTQYVPEEFKEKLKPLQGEGKELDSNAIKDILRKELGKEKFAAIENFELRALGAGSIGQVHKAQVSGKHVVFKVQYPEIKKSIETDIALLTPLSSVYEFIRPQAKDFSILLKETRSMLLSELDYELEKNHLHFFREKLQADKRYDVPAVIEEFSNERILCMEYHHGQPLSEMIKSTELTGELKKKTAAALLELFIDEFLVWGKVQTDPNFANYLIDNENKIILLDFGAVKSFDQSFRNLYMDLLVAGYHGDDEKILFYGEKLGLVSAADRKEAVALFISFMKDVLSYFHAEKNPMNFSDEEITQRLLVTGWKLFKEQRISNPHADLVFLHRKLGGLFSLLKEMKVEIDLHQFWRRIEEIKAGTLEKCPR